MREAVTSESIGSRLAPLTDGPFGRRGVARPEREELDAPALDRRAGPERAVGIDVALGVAVVGRVGVDQDARRPALLGVADLQAAEELAVADQDDLVLDVDPQLLEGGEVLGPAVVRVDDLPGDVARDAVAVEGGEGVGAGRVLVGRRAGPRSP